MIAAVRVALPLMNWPENSSRQPRYGAFLLMIVAAAAYYPRFVKLPAGMETYPQAASCLWYGQMLQVRDPGFTYPPFFALVMLPFAPMPLWLRDVVWYGVTLAATLGAFKLSEVLPVNRSLRRLSAPNFFGCGFLSCSYPPSSFSRSSRIRPMTRSFSLPYSLAFPR